MNASDVIDSAEDLVQRELRASAPPPPAVLVTGIVDMHSADGAYDLAAAKAGGIVALIHKATEGGDFVDHGHAAAMAACAQHGLLRGLYHFANGRPAAVQAANFLTYAKACPDALLALDIENNARSKYGTMDLAGAVDFVRRVHDAVGRWPVFYTYTSMLLGLMHGATDAERAVLAHCPLWVAQYGEPPQHVPAPWATWDLWQYTDGPKYGPADKARYPRTVPGFRDPVQDRSCYRGTAEQLAAWWASAGR